MDSRVVGTVQSGTVHSVGDIRKAWGSEWADASDDEVVRAYAKANGMDPSDVATRLGTKLSPAATTVHEPPSFADRLTEKAVGGAVLGVSLVLLVLFVGFAWRLSRRAKVALGKSALTSAAVVASMAENAKLSNVHVNSLDHDAVYEAAMGELDQGNLDKATWARAIVASGGDQSQARAFYIKMRVAKLTSQPS